MEGLIDQDPDISSQFTLWSHAGSRVIRVNTLVIPIGTSNLYVEPIYLQAENGPIPELKRVILATGNRLVMEPTLEEAIVKLFGTSVNVQAGGGPVLDGRVQPGGSQPTAETTSIDLTTLIRTATDRFTRSQEALRSGDWARYGEEQRALEADLRRLAELAGR